MIKKAKIAILISGRGSNMQALIEACKDPNFPAEVVLVLSNKKEALGLIYAKELGIKTAFINHKNFSSREKFDQEVSKKIEEEKAELICLAGFMRLLSPWFVNKWQGKAINIHPSLLPNFKGADAVGDAIKAKAKKSGCTTHYVEEKMDSGEIIMQAEVKIFENDTKESLAARILKEEHRIYPLSLKKVCEELVN